MSGIVEVVRSKAERPLVLMTNLQGQPCYLRPDFAERFVKKGWKYGYEPLKNPSAKAKEKAQKTGKTKKMVDNNYKKHQSVELGKIK